MRPLVGNGGCYWEYWANKHSLPRGFDLPGCHPSQLHQAQAHHPRLFMEDFTQGNRENNSEEAASDS